MDIASLKAIASALAIAGGVFGPGFAIGKIGSEAMKAIGRNPESTSKLFTPLILSLAFAEALGIYAFVIAFLLK